VSLQAWEVPNYAVLLANRPSLELAAAEGW
jgi:hypothetical protein